jgi:hypothetical protein
MSYLELGYQFLNYFIDCINLQHTGLAGVIKPDTQLTINNNEAIGPEQFINQLGLIGFHQLKIDSKYVIIQPLYWKNMHRNDYDGILILASGTSNILENGHYVNKNMHFSFVLENINGGYYINNLIIRLSEKSRTTQLNPQMQYNQCPYNNHAFMDI